MPSEDIPTGLLSTAPISKVDDTVDENPEYRIASSSDPPIVVSKSEPNQPMLPDGIVAGVKVSEIVDEKPLCNRITPVPLVDVKLAIFQPCH